VKRELIAGDVVGREGDGLLQGAFPDFERLARQAVDQIDRDRVEAGRAGDLDALPRLLGSVPAAQELQGLRVEGLNPQGEKTDAEIPPGADALRIDVLGIGLEGNPDALLDRKVFADGFEDPSVVLRRESGGRAAAEVDRVDPLEG
jgi:hypothetical protein